MNSNRQIIIRSIALFAITATILLAAFTSVPPIIYTVLLCALIAYLFFNNRQPPAFENEGTDSLAATKMSEEHQLLLESIRHYPMPYALYDKNDRLVVWNQHYENIHARAFKSLKDKINNKQMHYRDLIHSSAKETMSGQALKDYTDLRVANQRLEDGFIADREYPESGWYRVSKYTTPSGGVAGFAIDINELKQREAELIEEVERRKRLEVKIRKLANTDSLTGIANRRQFINRVEEEFNRVRQNDKTLCVMMLDIDHFKLVNDTYGHATGDEVIATVAKMTEMTLPSDGDLTGRLGGEEFAVLLTESTEEIGYQVAERIRQSIQALSFLSDNHSFTITVSVGVAYYSHSDFDKAELLKRADKALYQAKADGRNRVEVSGNIDGHGKLARG